LTLRAIIIGLLVTVLIPTVGYFSDQVLRLTIFIGNQFPIVVFAPLVLVLILGGALGRRRRLAGAELAVILTMAMVACNVPGGGLLRMFTRSIAMPIHFNENNLAWQKAGVLKLLHPVMLPNDGKYDQAFMTGFLSGSAKPISPDKLPWDKWTRTLSFWWPLTFLLGFASICLGLVVHNQWSLRERLRYPIADFANSLLAYEGPGRDRPVLRHRLFWLGLICLLALHIVNGLAKWWPNEMISIPMGFDFDAVLKKFPKLATHWVANCLFGVAIWPMVVAFGFLIPSDVSLSLGLSEVFWVLITAWLVNGLGVEVHGADDLGGPTNWQRAGSAVAVAAMILYTGRRYYWEVLKRAVTFRRSDEAEGYVAWACRLLVLSMAAMVAMLTWVGLDWPFAVLLVMLLMLIYLIQARINAESGLILSLLTWLPSIVLLGLFGAKAFGPKAMIICGLVGAIFARDTHECLMPFFMNALRISQSQDISPRRAGPLAAAAFGLALLVGVPFGLWVDHNYGVLKGEHFATNVAPQWTFDATASTVDLLDRTQELDESRSMSVWHRFTGMKPEAKFLWAAGLGFAAVLMISALRLRFTWWPIHPMMFLVWGTWSMAMLNHSFLIGWAIKKLVTKFGGARGYIAGRYLMFGVIAGELLGGLLWMIVGAIYYACTGQKPIRYQIFPSGG
jgi:hypothetical protein